MTRIRIPTRAPDDWRRLLADPIVHWRVGYSAYELAHAWQGAAEFPPAVTAVLASAPLGELELLCAFPEHKVSVPGRGAASATDLFALARNARGELVAIAVEGKVRESFDKRVSEWLDDPTGNRENRENRLNGLATLLGVEARDLDEVPYQLLHRTAAALIEATRYNAAHAVLLVHSFSHGQEHHSDYKEFVKVFGASGEPGVLESAGTRNGIALHVCWVSDQPRTQTHEGEPEPVLLEAVGWLRDTYREHRFFKERDVEAALQQRMSELFEERRSEWRVYENHRVPGKQIDLVVVDRNKPAEVALGVELKYEPDHARGGRDMRGDTEKFPVCPWNEVQRDHDELLRCVADGVIGIGYALVLDEGGYWRTRKDPPPFGRWNVWGEDSAKRMAPALLISRAVSNEARIPLA